MLCLFVFFLCRCFKILLLRCYSKQCFFPVLGLRNLFICMLKLIGKVTTVVKLINSVQFSPCCSKSHSKYNLQRICWHTAKNSSLSCNLPLLEYGLRGFQLWVYIIDILPLLHRIWFYSRRLDRTSHFFLALTFALLTTWMNMTQNAVGIYRKLCTLCTEFVHRFFISGAIK